MLQQLIYNRNVNKNYTNSNIKSNPKQSIKKLPWTSVQTPQKIYCEQQQQYTTLTQQQNLAKLLIVLERSSKELLNLIWFCLVKMMEQILNYESQFMIKNPQKDILVCERPQPRFCDHLIFKSIENLFECTLQIAQTRCQERSLPSSLKHNTKASYMNLPTSSFLVNSWIISFIMRNFPLKKFSNIRPSYIQTQHHETIFEFLLELFNCFGNFEYNVLIQRYYAQGKKVVFPLGLCIRRSYSSLSNIVMNRVLPQ
eukprot:TRINITY_DN813_c3_g1_i2.p1 TRINITY_DN813_c3_g1~~TRINITY_DN813_c3_g1_i2.p1  ORF type:complete len:255 (+),score=-6.75 TRINITY_DN813_c3_g1_i2:529-1293(+)